MNKHKNPDYHHNYYLAHKESYRNYSKQDNVKQASCERMSKYYYSHRQPINIHRKNIMLRNKMWLKDNGYLKCQRCNYNEFDVSLDAHHLNPLDKKNSHDNVAHWLHISSIEKFQHKIQTSRIIFLCKNCHAALHSHLWNIDILN
jgi:DNA-directed RNA polymerase subunit M/transcription elongation factor TFIIS